MPQCGSGASAGQGLRRSQIGSPIVTETFSMHDTLYISQSGKENENCNGENNQLAAAAQTVWHSSR